ncbi:FimV/HubP family polar landmark protein [Oceanisphaera avium]|uniref:Pilus assembly protein FimV n=1 Tax=Oceanisphaera avium TaxID=1903694 RepID=A0A1Y0CWQ8_9GAMM|nr:FimV/HubP family polar landmark protein [Oceanisphaera avium]ART79444.1 hypothetical protein CBP12_04165 [Oceanisphaera avium]
MKRLKPYLGVGIAAWVASASLVMAQEDFYIELRGPEGQSSAQTRQAPAARPVQQVAPAQASRPIQQIGSAQTTSGRYGPIRSTDTLWTIAEKYTRSPVTVQQTMVALYHLNPRSFVRGNINNLQRGAYLRLPTESQARQRSAGEAQAEFGRLTRQGNRRVTQAATAPKPVLAATSQPKTGVTAPKPAAATPAAPKASTKAAPNVAQPPKNEPAVASNGLSEPKAAAKPTVTPAPSAVTESESVEPASPATTPQSVEEAQLTRLQLQLMDELREQVSMSNEQLANLSDNNQALRQHLAQLTAEVAALKASAETPTAPEAEPEEEGWFKELLNNPLNLALLLILPALLLLALFTLWWRNREKRDLVEQEQALAETSILMEEDKDEFSDLFSSEPEETLLNEQEETIEPAPIAEQNIDEDAFARFLEEQQQLEEVEAEQQVPAPPAEPEVEPEAEPNEGPLEDTLFDDEASFTSSDDALSNEELDDLFSMTATQDDIGLTADEQALSEEDTASEASVEDAFAEQDLFAVDPQASDADSEELASDWLNGPLSPEQLAAAGLSEVAPSESELKTPVTAAQTEQASDEADTPPARLMDDWPEPVAEAEPEDTVEPYVSVDELMADAERGEGPEPDLERSLNLELDDYANVMGQGQNVDIDIDEGGVSSQLDLARAYLEIDDADSARDLLNQALERGNAEQQRDAKKLLQRLDKRA